jgi:hypothetical protein
VGWVSSAQELLDQVDDLGGDVEGERVVPALLEPVGELGVGVGVLDVDVELEVAVQSGAGEVGGADVGPP